MSAPATTTDLPALDAKEAQTRGLLAIAGLARLYRVTMRDIRKVLDRPGSPDPVGVLPDSNGVRRPALYSMEDFIRFVDSVDGANGHITTRRRAQPVRRVGTRTPTANGPYVWRDPSRWGAQSVLLDGPVPREDRG